MIVYKGDSLYIVVIQKIIQLNIIDLIKKKFEVILTLMKLVNVFHHETNKTKEKKF